MRMGKFPRRTIALALPTVSLLCAALGSRALRSAAGGEQVWAAAPVGAVALRGEPTRIPLVPSPGAEPWRERFATLGPGKHLFLILGDLRATAPPGVVYGVYLGLPPGPIPDAPDPYFVGTLNFFAVTPPAAAAQPFRSYDVTGPMKTLLSIGLPDASLAVTIVPVGAGPESSSAQPTIGRIVLVAQ
jgi:hypothetical protein